MLYPRADIYTLNYYNLCYTNYTNYTTVITLTTLLLHIYNLCYTNYTTIMLYPIATI